MRDRSLFLRRRLVLPACLVLAALAGPAHALKFRPVDDGKALLVYDCGAIGDTTETKESCKPYQSGFYGAERFDDGFVYRGDAFELESRLRAQTYSRIYLWSGGGDLDEGVKLGSVLRKYKQYVIVAKGTHCISACTVAFLGGVVRDVEPEGSYEVHAYSSYSRKTNAELKAMLERKGDGNYFSSVRRSIDGAMAEAQELFLYAQQMINGKPDPAAVKAVMLRTPDFAKRYVEDGTAQKDIDLINKEGVATAQNVLMKIERESFGYYLDQLRASADALGPRAAHAIKMLEIMFSSRITETYALDQTTLKEMGYTNVRRDP